MKRAVLRQGIPVFLSYLLQGFHVFLFIVCLSRLYTNEALASFSLAHSFYLSSAGFLSGTVSGALSFFAKRISKGASEKEQFSPLIAMIAGLLLSVLTIILCKLLQPLYFLLGQPESRLYQEEAENYLNLVQWSLLFVGASMPLSAYLIFKEKAWQLFKLNVIALLIHLTCASLLFFLNLSPQTALQWVAFSFLLANAIVFSINFHYLGIFSHVGDFQKISFQEIMFVLEASFFSGAQTLLIIIGFAILIIFCTKAGTTSVGMMMALLSIQRLFIVPLKSLGTSVGAFTAKALAKGQHKVAQDILKQAVLYLGYVISPVACCMIVFPSFILSLLLQYPVCDSNDILCTRVAGLSLLCEPIASIISNALKAQAHSQSIFALTAGQWVIILPLCWYFINHLKYSLLLIWLLILTCRWTYTACCIYLWKQSLSTKQPLAP